MRINQNQVVEAEIFEFTAEASTLGMKPGKWPEIIETDIGNGYPFLLSRPRLAGDQLLAMIYQQQHGCYQLVIFND